MVAMKYDCTVCASPDFVYPPRDYNICTCCGTEFGNDDARFTHAQLRSMWVGDGARWFFGNPPTPWNPWFQLIDGGFQESVPHYVIKLITSANIKVGPTLNVGNDPLIFTAT